MYRTFKSVVLLLTCIVLYKKSHENGKFQPWILSRGEDSGGGYGANVYIFLLTEPGVSETKQTPVRSVDDRMDDVSQRTGAHLGLE